MKKNSKIIIVFAVIIVATGIFLRSYNFSEWLRFNMDQSRDIALVEDSIQNNSFPDFGPKAGGTGFKLGPAFYYFQIISAKIFGATPASVAYPDLFFSLLSILLFFLLARILFSRSIALSLTWLFSISYFAIKYSRFAWNPNSTPFFTMLFIYAVYQMNRTAGKKKIAWASLAGVAMGIGMQLHTTLLIILPVIALIFAYLLFKNKTLTKISAVVVFVGMLLVNVPQIRGEIKTGWLNTRMFIFSLTEKNSRNNNILNNVALNATCHIRANFGILSSFSNEEECGYSDIASKTKKLDGKRMPLAEKTTFILYILAATIFSIGGYWLTFREMRKEIDPDRKIFLKLVFSYIILTFLFFTVWATELSMRFFLILEFVPFFLLGFWLKFILEKSGKIWIIVALVVLFSILNLQKNYAVFRDLQFGGREVNGDFEYLTLGEANFVTQYIKDNNGGNMTAYIDAQAGYLFKSFRSLRFVAQKSDIDLIEFGNEVKLESGARLFYLKSASEKCQLPEKISKKYEIEKCALYRQFSVFSLRVR